MVRDGSSWLTKHWPIVATIITLLVAGTSGAIGVQQRISVHDDQLQRHDVRIEQLGSRVSEDHDRIQEAIGDLKHIRREVDRSNAILDRIDKRMP